MKFYIEENIRTITKMFEELDKDKAWLLEIKDNEFLGKYVQEHINYIEKILNNLIVVKE